MLKWSGRIFAPVRFRLIKLALPALRQAVETTRSSERNWGRLAHFYGAVGDLSELVKCWERVLAIAPDQTQAHFELACALQIRQRYREAIEHYQAALNLDVTFAAAHLRLANLYEASGDRASAEMAFRKAMLHNSEDVRPLVRLATCLSERLPVTDFALLKERLGDSRLPIVDHARLLFAMGHVLDSRSDYQSAAQYMKEAHRKKHDWLRSKSCDYRAIEHQHHVDSIMDAFGPKFFKQFAGAGVLSCRPIFVFGLPRSGTTLVEQVLATHSQVYGAGELHLGPRTFELACGPLGRKLPHRVARLDREVLGELASRHLEKLDEIDGGMHARIIDKMPGNYLYLGFLATLFPRATFIHCQRHLRDVALSCWMQDFRSITWTHTVDDLASRFSQYCRVMKHWYDEAPVKIHQVKYETLVSDFERTSRKLLAACGLEWEDRCLEFYRTTRTNFTPSANQVRQPIYTRSIGRWRNYAQDLSELFVRLRENSYENPNAGELEEICAH